MKKFLRYLIVASFILGSIQIPFVRAEEILDENPLPNYSFEASVGIASLSRDLALSAFENKLEVGMPGGQLLEPTVVKLTQLNETVKAPAGLSLADSLYQIDIPAAVFKPGRYFISIKSSGSDFHKRIYFFDKNFAGGGWRPLPTNENFGKGVVSTYLTAPFVRLGVFENKNIPVKGRASWYRYKNGNFAASPDFPIGTRLRVINLDNKKSVDVVVNDYGPNRALHPERVVDLDAVAFARIAPLGQGTARIAVEWLPEQSAPAPAPEPVSSNGEPVVSAKAALIFNSADKKVIWSKAETTALPLASLTKVVAVKVFLETKSVRCRFGQPKYHPEMDQFGY